MITKSVWKAVRDVLITALSLAGVAFGTYFYDPAVLQPIVDVVPGTVGTILIVLVPIGAKALVDWLKHR